MAIVPRPRPYAERPTTPLAPPKPANDDGTGILGSWENGTFKFASPQARETWRQKSYEQGVSEDAWHLGKEVDLKSAAILQAGLGGANSGLFQGPDGKLREMNPKTIESQAARDHRNKFLTGKSMDQIAAAGTMPGAEEWVAKWRAAQLAANDNAAEVKPTPQPPVAASTTPPPTALAETDLQTDAGAGRTMGGRFAGMQGAQKNADVQGAQDLARIATNAVLGNYGDEVRAGFGAAGALFEGKSFGDAYNSNLEKEMAESAAAQERQGLAGTGVELLTSFIPIIGDASGALADFKDWQEHGDDWGWGDYGLAALGVVPGMLNRRLVKKGEKALGELLDEGKVAISGGALDLQKSPLTRGNSLDQYLPSNEIVALTQRQAEALTGRNRGIFYMTESFTGKEPAKIFHDGTVGAFSSIEHKKRVVPALRYDNPDGKNFIRFDGVEVAEDGNHLLLIDAKRSLPLWKPSAMNDLKDTLERIKHAVKQNNTDGVDGIQYKVVYEFPNRYTAKVAAMFLAGSGYGDLISVRVRQQ